MPHPIIIFQHHFSGSSEEFLLKNIQELQNLGYKKVLFEMNEEFTPSQVKELHNTILNDPTKKDYHFSSQISLDLFKALENKKIPYAFIDPESSAEGGFFNQAASFLLQQGFGFDSPQMQALLNQREAKTVKRDKIMAERIASEAEGNQGGVIVLIGFCHKLSTLLNKTEEQEYKFMVIKDKTKESWFPNPEARDEVIWKNLNDPTYRRAYYQKEVELFDLSENSNFALIEATLGLTKAKICNESPTVATYLEKAEPLKFSLYKDEAYVITAATSVKKEQSELATLFLKTTFPGLTFFSENKGDKTLISIPAINTPEQGDALKKGYGT